ncbi:AAA domain-containing protein [Pontibacter sp. BT731]|uniref:AAA domain-containing protein n=1 Tax=Pontibacter coccineus TaxID=3063328 RepID=UPI0026E13739|nr:AAA domain-containing protein [Pontibacter sp. BT731]MDO6389519.1 AAA domain-containing protein [Pontibacter sp. BT731]
MKSILKSYRHRLLNLSAGNRALLLLRLSRELHLDVNELDFINNKPAFHVLEKVISGKTAVLAPFADSRYAPVTPVSQRLRFIRRKAGMILEERGSRELYLGWPFVHGQFADGTTVRCPLLFFPVQLQVNSKQEWELLPDPSQPAQFNQSFVLAYAHYMGTPLAEALLELDLGTLPPHPLEFRTQVYELLKENQLTVHAGREFFTDKLKPFHDFRKADYEADLKSGQLYLEQEAVLGLYPQAASYMLGDYDELLQRSGLQEMEDLFTGPDTGITQAATQAQHTFTAFAMDASQEAALQQVKQGRSLVVQGPPGTGKSQLICNLVSDFTARGKRVLVVSQKRAALDVVHQRLSSAGLGPFAALVHDINADRKNIYQQLLLQIDQIEEYKKQNLALNSIYTDRTFLEVSRGINQCLQKLEGFRTALFDSSRCGWSPKELYLRSSLQQPHVQLSEVFRQFTATTVTDFLPRLRACLQQGIVLEQPGFIWKERHSMRGFGWPQQQEMERTIEALPEQYRAMQQGISQLSGAEFELSSLERFRTAYDTLDELQHLLEREGVPEVLRPLLQKEAKASELKKLVRQLKGLYLVCPAPDAAIPIEQLTLVKSAITVFEAKKKDFLKGIGWYFSQDKKVLQQALAKYRLELTPKGVGELQRRIELREQAQELIKAINKSIRYTLRLEDNPTPMLQKLEVVERALEAHQLLKQLHRERVLHEKMWLETNLPSHLQALAQALQVFEQRYGEWEQWLPKTHIGKLAEQEGYSTKLLESLQQYFEQLVAYDELRSTLTVAEQEVCKQVLREGIATAQLGESLFMNSLYLAWLHELEGQWPELRMPDSGELERVETDLQNLLQQKQDLSQEIVLSRLREQTYRNMEFNRLGNAVTYRRLHAQVSKKRSLYPIRKLFELFSEEILNLAPCWLASPETVSAVFPLERCFDLVIFDEASQCFAETGIPAMLRGQQAVVAGDEQQLRPSDLYRSRWGGNGNEEPEELTAESLLQLCGLYLPQTMLTQHYRSRFPELIDFSNRNFYRNRLELIPELQDVNARQPAIQFVKVQGLWQQNSNLPEAEKVVEQVWQLVQSGVEDVGVITFNYSQQMLVQDLLEDKAQLQGIALPPTVTVKNIENMQGDEKEVVILSVGYAPDAKGKMVMQFGSLNQSGGENRLNVAISRARQMVIVVSSIRSEQLQVDNAQHAGPKLLRDYLHYAQQVSRRYFKYEPQALPMPAQVPMLKEQLALAIPALQAAVPFADLTVVEDGNFSSVVLTDDDLYFNNLSVRHAHADIPKLLRQRNWPFQRVYSRQYWANKEALFRKLKGIGVREMKG